MPAPDEPGAGRAKAIRAVLGQIGYALPGSITIRRTRCGKPRCACNAGPPALHGPYIQWTRTVHGKTVTRNLTPAQYETYAPWLANSASSPPNSKPSHSLKWPAPKPGPPSPPAPARQPAPASSVHQNHPNHPEHREISPPNTGTAPRNHPGTPGQRVLSVTPQYFAGQEARLP